MPKSMTNLYKFQARKSDAQHTENHTKWTPKGNHKSLKMKAEPQPGSVLNLRRWDPFGGEVSGSRACEEPGGPWAQYMYRLAWTCRLNRQDWNVESIVLWAGSFILIGMWNESICGQDRLS